jgi:hypothetical protein
LVRRPLIGLLYQHQMIDDEEYGTVGGMRIGRGNRSIGRKPAPVPLCTQVPHDLTWARTRAAAMGSQRLIALATARPLATGCTAGESGFDSWHREDISIFWSARQPLYVDLYIYSATRLHGVMLN